MPWESSRTFKAIDRTHYSARCSDCGLDGEVCVQRRPAVEDAEKVAVTKLLRGGWHADGLGFGKRLPSDARWLCPKCAKLERRG